jgi:hypothetical protein
MAILLSNTGGTQAAPSRIRQWLSQKISARVPLTNCSVSDASPLVVTKNNHELAMGDIVVGTGATNNTAANGVFQAYYLSSSTFGLVPLGSTLTSGNQVNGGGSASDTGVKFQRLYVGLLPHDLLNMQTTISRVGYNKDLDSLDPTYPNEPMISTLVGGTTTL